MIKPKNKNIMLNKTEENLELNILEDRISDLLNDEEDHQDSIQNISALSISEDSKEELQHEVNTCEKETEDLLNRYNYIFNPNLYN